ncbi:MAG TPA: hypothetical protein VM911_09675 [Pyrinomonadaceae bacterium]|jgi:hypothetical protein|nr:hypothetical protein [Pyrinomonadaceae bacterium]
MATVIFNQLSLAPLGAGDLIDRAVRLYRHHFITLIGISAPPVLISTLGSVLWTVGWREFVATSSEVSLAIYVTMLIVGGTLLLTGTLLNLIVMAGATRNLVTHLLWNEPVSARTTYRNVRARFWGLLGASILVGAWVAFSAALAFFGWMMIFYIMALGAILFAFVASWLSAIVGFVGLLFSLVAGLWFFFFLIKRFVYVPQVMLVEGKGVFEAFTRSSALARGNVRRLMAMFLFTTFASWAALMILIIPLGWYGYLNGIDPSPFNAASWPAWYAIGYSVVSQLSSILLAPIWTLGLSLLYVDERVRHEGYDIELMAARVLGEMPLRAGAQETASYIPALVTTDAPQSKPPAQTSGTYGSVLNLR